MAEARDQEDLRTAPQARAPWQVAEPELAGDLPWRYPRRLEVQCCLLDSLVGLSDQGQWLQGGVDRRTATKAWLQKLSGKEEQNTAQERIQDRGCPGLQYLQACLMQPGLPGALGTCISDSVPLNKDELPLSTG
jgi:hypothetical protein